MRAVADRIRAAVATVEDPEVPVTLQDLGVVREVRVEGSTVHVLLRPTRLACPARGEMARRVREAVGTTAPGVEVEVDWEMATWGGGEVSDRGTEVLLQIGYADPGAHSPACPYCGSDDVRSEGAFGGAVCKVPFSCRSCGSTFDALKGTAAAASGASVPDEARTVRGALRGR